MADFSESAENPFIPRETDLASKSEMKKPCAVIQCVFTVMTDSLKYSVTEAPRLEESPEDKPDARAGSGCPRRLSLPRCWRAGSLQTLLGEPSTHQELTPAPL